MVSRQTIAGVVLTLNEENDLDRSLSSLHWCDELLVLDSGSTDSTSVIAAKYGARFITHIQDSAFLITDQRNWALHNCDLKSDWVLFLDADESISPSLLTEISEFLLDPTDLNAIYLAPRYWFLGKWLKHIQNFPNWHPRLVRRGSVSFQGGVWETFSDNAKTGYIKHPYEHYAFSKGLDSWIDRHKRYADWEAYLTISNHENIKHHITLRRSIARLILFKFWPLRPFAVLFNKLVFQLGILDGLRGILYCFLVFTYEVMIVIKIIETKRKRLSLPL